MLRSIRNIHNADRAPLAAAALFITLATVTACSTREEPDGGRPETGAASTPAGTGTSGGEVTPVPSAPVMPVRYEEGELAFQEKRYAEAKEKFTSYVEQRPENPWGHYMLGLSAWKSGDRLVAESAFVSALERDPRHVKSLLNLTRVLLEDGRPREARERVTTALTLDSTSSEVHRLMGRVYSELKQHNEAIVSYRMALSLDPTDVWSMNNMALILIQQDRHDEALPALARATQLEPDVPVFQNNLGIALERSGRFTLAAQAYGAAVAADSGYQKAVMSLARVQSLKDDPALVPIELGSLAEAFDRGVRGMVVGVTKEPTDTTKPPR